MMKPGEIAINKTRIAPTPSGFLHIGNAFSFVVTAFIAKRGNTGLLLRIDDLDRQRYRTEFVEDIFRVLDFLEIEWQEGPTSIEAFEKQYSQIHRMELYYEALSELQKKGLVYGCTCSRSELAAFTAYPGFCKKKNLALEESGTSWRLHTDHRSVKVNTYEAGHHSAKLADEMQDFVVRKKDGAPSYQLASLLDDHHFKVNLVVRGRDLYESTIAQLYLAQELRKTDFLNAQFHHHLLLKDAEGQKLSKTHFSESLSKMVLAGFEREELFALFSEFLNLPAKAEKFSDICTLLEEHYNFGP